MNKKTKAVQAAKPVTSARRGWCIFIDMLCGGPGPVESVTDGKAGSPSRWMVHDTELEAQLEIADGVQEKLRQFIESKGEEREFEDAIGVEEYVVPVQVDEAGNVWDLIQVDGEGTIFETGKCHGTGPE